MLTHTSYVPQPKPWIHAGVGVRPRRRNSKDGGLDCGLYSLANATALCHGVDPTTCIYERKYTRNHFHMCLLKKDMKLFPVQRQRKGCSQPVKLETYVVYCHCRLPWDKHHSEDSMTMCSQCKEWFHETCDRPESYNQSQWTCKSCNK